MSDLALETLLAVRDEVAPNLNADLLRACYLVANRFQFDREPEQSVQAINRLIDDRVEIALAETSSETAAERNWSASLSRISCPLRANRKSSFPKMSSEMSCSFSARICAVKPAS